MRGRKDGRIAEVALFAERARSEGARDACSWIHFSNPAG